MNVHPTKQEVRLSKEEELFSLVSKAINDKLREQVLIPNVGANLDFKQKVNPKEQVKPTQLNPRFITCCGEKRWKVAV